jgi:hypothetical protein
VCFETVGDDCPGFSVSVSPNSTVTLSGDTRTGMPPADAVAKTCFSEAEELVYAITSDAAGILEISVWSDGINYDPVVYTRLNSCVAGPELECVHDGYDPQVLELSLQPIDTLWLFVDGADAESVGPFTLTLNLIP